MEEAIAPDPRSGVFPACTAMVSSFIETSPSRPSLRVSGGALTGTPGSGLGAHHSSIGLGRGRYRERLKSDGSVPVTVRRRLGQTCVGGVGGAWQVPEQRSMVYTTQTETPSNPCPRPNI